MEEATEGAGVLEGRAGSPLVGTRLPRYFLTKYFAVTAAIAVFSTLIGLGTLYYLDEVTQLTEASTEKKKSVSEAFSRSFWPQFAWYFREIDHTMIPDKRLAEMSRSIDLAVGYLTQGVPVEDFRVILAGGRVAYAMSGREFGQMVPVTGGFQEALENGSGVTHLEKFGVTVQPDGGLQPRYLSNSYFPVFDADNRVEAVLQVVDDVTSPMERAKGNILRILAPSLVILLVFLLSITVFAFNADRVIGAQRSALRRSAERHKRREEKFRAIADYSHDLELWIAEDREILWINPAVQRLIGDSIRVALEARNYLLSVTHDMDKAKLETLIEDAISGGQTDGVEFRLKTKAGAVKWVAASYQPIRSESGVFLGSRWSVRDISERKSMEEALRASEVRFRTVANSAADAIVCINDRGNITFWNPAATNIFGHAEGDIVGKNVTAIMPERFRSSHQDGFGRVVRGGHSKIMNTVVEVMGQKSSGKEFPIELTVSRAQAKNQHFFTAVIRDITVRKEAERDQQRTLDVLTRANAELERFAFVAAHDLQEPSRSIVSFCQLLERRLKDRIDSESREYMDYVMEGAMRMRSLVKDLLRYTSIDRTESSFEAIDVEDILDQVKENLRVRIQERNVEITAEGLPRVSGDGTQLLQLFQNLVSNAIKFTPHDRTPIIRIKGSSVEGDCVITVTDNGIGIEQKYLSLIFAPFKRLHSIKDYPGSGVGLAICQRIVERHGGKIWAESSPGAGTTFRLTLHAPSKAGDPARLSTTSESASAACGGSLKSEDF